MQGFKEDKSYKVTPVLHLNYRPYSSYMPHYESTFANISQDDSDLISSIYGEDSHLPSDFSIHEILAHLHAQINHLVWKFTGCSNKRKAL